MSFKNALSLGRKDRRMSLKSPIWSHLSTKRQATGERLSTLTEENSQSSCTQDQGSMQEQVIDPFSADEITLLLNAYINSPPTSDAWTIALEIARSLSLKESSGREAANIIRFNLERSGDSVRQCKAVRLWGILLRRTSPSFRAVATSRKFCATIENTLTDAKARDPNVYAFTMFVLSHAAYILPGETNVHARQILKMKNGDMDSNGYLMLYLKVKSPSEPDIGSYIKCNDPTLNPPDHITGAIQFRIENWASTTRLDDDIPEARHILSMTGMSEENARVAIDTVMAVFVQQDMYSQLKVLYLLFVFVTYPSDIILAHLTSNNFLTTFENAIRSAKTQAIRNRAILIIGIAANVISECDPSWMVLSQYRRNNISGIKTLWSQLRPDSIPPQISTSENLDPALHQFATDIHNEILQPQVQPVPIPGNSHIDSCQLRNIRNVTREEPESPGRPIESSRLSRAASIITLPVYSGKYLTDEPSSTTRDYSDTTLPAYATSQTPSGVAGAMRIDTVGVPLQLEGSFRDGPYQTFPVSPNDQRNPFCEPSPDAYHMSEVAQSLEGNTPNDVAAAISLNSLAGTETTWVRACQDYTGHKDGYLYFQYGDIIQVVDRSHDHWWYGIHVISGKYGMFPLKLVERAPNQLISRASLVRALYDFNPEKIGNREEGELHFRKDQLIRVVKEDNQLWWTGSLNNREGLIPVSYLEVIERVPIYDLATVVEATDDFEPTEPGQLRFRKHDKITVLSENSGRWWTGILSGEVGRFPRSLVKRHHYILPNESNDTQAFAPPHAVSTSCQVLVRSDTSATRTSLHTEVIIAGSGVPGQFSSDSLLHEVVSAHIPESSRPSETVINISNTVSVSAINDLSTSALLAIFKKMGLVPTRLESPDNLDAKEFINLAVEARGVDWDAIALQPNEIHLFYHALSEMCSSESCSSALAAKCQRWIRKMASHTGVLPQSLFVKRAKRHGALAVAGGGFSDIFRGTLDGQEVALKVLRSFNVAYATRKAFAVEALVWYHLKHKNILPMLGVCEDCFAPRLCLVAPWMENGNIMQYLAKHPEINPQQLLLQGAEGLTYLHGLDPSLIHGDIKGSNMLIDQNGEVRLTDFGLVAISQTQSLATTSRASAEAGSIRWMAPELHQQGVHRSRPSDVFAFGMTMLEVFTRKAPFSELHGDSQVLFAVIQNCRPPRPPPKIVNGLTKEVWGLIEECWQSQPSDRPVIGAVALALKLIAQP